MLGVVSLFLTLDGVFSKLRIHYAHVIHTFDIRAHLVQEQVSISAYIYM
jgi:hypothetical protein